MERLNDILQPHCQASKIRLSYVEDLFPDLKDNQYIILHKYVPHAQFTDYDNRENSEYFMRYDVSGAPLEYSFGICEFDDTITLKHNWQKEDELYLPLNRSDACNALNICLDHLDNNIMPILALCDGKDSKQSRLIGITIYDNWFTTLEAVSIGTTTLTTARNECYRFVNDHIKQSFVQEHDIKIFNLKTFDLYGVKQERIDWDKVVHSNFEGSVNIETYSNNLILDTRLSKNTLIVQINAGWKDSPLKELRCQLLLLAQYLSMIDECKKIIGVQNPIKFTTPYLKEHDAITEQLSSLLSGDINFKDSGNSNIKRINYINRKNVEINAKLLERVQNVSLRQNVDFTDHLWEILIGASEYSQIISYIETILKEVLEYKFISQVNDTNSTRLMKHISDLHHQGTISHLLVGSVPIELVIDIGFEKLIRDYIYILKGARLVDMYDIRQNLVDISSGIFNTEHYRKKLNILAQMHICLECMLFVEAHLGCPIESLQSIFAYIYKEFLSEQSPLQHYTELCNRFYTLMVPLPSTMANELNKMDPTMWRVTLSSCTAASMLKTTIYYSKMPIFPTNIYPTDNVNEKEVYGISATSSSAKFKELWNVMS